MSSTIDHTLTFIALNNQSRARAAKTGDAWQAMEQIASENGFQVLARSDSAIIYEATTDCVLPDGARINCWIDAPSCEIETGGLGFDDQTEWYTE